jgi:hypothetical protein
VAAAGQDEAQLRAFSPQDREGLEQPLVILVRPRPRRVEQERLALLFAGTEPLVVEAERNRMHALGRNPEVRDHAAADELARDDDGVRGTGRSLVGEAAVGAFRPAEELR